MAYAPNTPYKPRPRETAPLPSGKIEDGEYLLIAKDLHFRAELNTYSLQA